MAKPNTKNIMQREHIDSREFSYIKGPVGLKFSLRTDVKTELTFFKELLETALADVTAELEKKR